MTSKLRLVFMAHADDEAFVLPELVALNDGLPTEFVLFTRDLKKPDRRFFESRRALDFMGFESSKLYDLRCADDGKLVHSLAVAFEAVKNILLGRGESIEVVCPSWEGGHQDHDALFVVAQKLRAEVASVSIRTYWLYDGQKTSGKFFQVAQSHGKAMAGRLPPTLRSIVLPLRYSSQVGAWLGLIWGYWGLRIVKRTFNLSNPVETFVLAKPHEGRLLYERWQRETWDNFQSNARNFLKSGRD